jgi:hypothetical protein
VHGQAGLQFQLTGEILTIPRLQSDGFLPPGKHRASVNDVREHFVDAFPTSETRGHVFELWRRQTAAVIEIMPIITHWIGGSFTTAKVNPADIDIVMLLNGIDFDALSGGEREKLLNAWRTPGSAIDPSYPRPNDYDRYLVFMYPANHRFESLSEHIARFWERRWGCTRPDKDGLVHRRGFVEVLE